MFDLSHLTDYTIGYLEELKKNYGADFPRHTEIEQIEQIDRKAAALNNIKIGWDRKAGYIGTSVKSEDTITCNEFDKLLMVARDGMYKVTGLPAEKLFVGKFYEIRKYDSKQEFGVIYKDNKSGKYYGKRSVVDKFITDKEYHLIPENCRMALFTPQPDGLYDLQFGAKKHEELNLLTLPLRSARARGLLMAGKSLTKITRLRDLTAEEIAEYRSQEVEVPPDDAPDTPDDTSPNTTPPAPPAPEPAPEPEPVPEPAPSPAPAPEPEPAPEPPPAKPKKVKKSDKSDKAGKRPAKPVPEPAPEPVPALEPAPEPVSDPKTAPKPEPVPEPEAEDDFELSSEAAVPHRRPVRKPAERPAKPEKKDSDDDELGIVQPEFGF